MRAIKKLKKDKLEIEIHNSRDSMGQAAASDAAIKIRELLETREFVNVIFAAAPSQNETLKYLIKEEKIDWTRVRAFHMDEYIGLSKDAPQAFGNFLKRAIFDKLPFKEVFYINDTGSSDELIDRYTKLLEKFPPDIVMLGIGENGHIAFNDPHIANFNDNKLIKIVDLDNKCRLQQVHDGCFENINSVPTHALTLTIPALTRAKYMFCTVPSSTKAEAVYFTTTQEIGEWCPATVMRNHGGAKLYADSDSGKYIAFNTSIITDEVSQNIEVAAKFATQNHLRGVEIRSVDDCAPENFSDEIIGKILDVTSKNHLEIVAISSSIFKSKWLDIEPEKIEKTIALAHKFGCKFIRAFSFYSDERFNIEEFKTVLQELSRRLEKERLTLVIESDPSVNLESCLLLAAALEVINLPNIKAIFDGGNDLYLDAPQIDILDSYARLKKHIAHIHIKDAKKNGAVTDGVALGKGDGNFLGLFKALLKDKYDGYVVMETHYRKAKRLDEASLKNPGGEKFSEGGLDSSLECVENMFELIAEAIREAK